MTSFASRFTLLSALALLAAAPAAHAQQKLVPAQSSLSFVIKQMGVPVEGQFKTFDAQVAFDPAKLASRATQARAMSSSMRVKPFGL